MSETRKRVLKRDLATAAVLCVLTAVVFANIFKNDFVGYDDQNLIERNQKIRSLSPAGIARMFAPGLRGNYQPLRTLSYALDYAVWGMRPFGFHLGNIVFHAATVIGVWLLLRKLAPDPTAILGAVIFAVHPIHVESVTWMSGRKDVLCLTFFLAAVLLYERSESNGKPWAYIASIFATGLALLSKLTAVSIPLCILLFELCRNGRSGQGRLRRTLVRLAPHILVVCLVIGLNFVRPEGASSHGDALADLEQAGRTVTRDIRLSMPLVVCRYVGLLLAPYHLSTHYDVARISRIFDPRFLAPVAFLLGLAGLGVFCFFKGRKLVAFGLGWFALAFLPTSNLIPAGALMVDRYMHIPSVGFAALLAAALLYPARAFSGREKSTLRLLALLPAAIVVLLFSTLTIRRNADWRDTTALFTRTLMVNPRSTDAYLAIGAMHVKAGDIDSAIETFRRGIEIDPDHYRIHYALGLAYKSKGWLNEAIQAFEKSSALNPDYLGPHTNLALCYHQQKRYLEAIAEHREVLRLSPNNAASHADLGRIYLEIGEPKLALAELDLALEADPNLVSALIDRAGLLMQRGMREEAQRDLRRLESLGVDTRAAGARPPGGR